MITELFYSRILHMQKTSLDTRSFSCINSSAFRYTWTTSHVKMALRARNVSGAFEKRARHQQGPAYVFCNKCKALYNKAATSSYYLWAQRVKIYGRYMIGDNYTQTFSPSYRSYSSYSTMAMQQERHQTKGLTCTQERYKSLHISLPS